MLGADPDGTDATEGKTDVGELLDPDAEGNGSGDAGDGFEGTGSGLRPLLSEVALGPFVVLPLIGVGSTVTVRVPETVVVPGLVDPPFIDVGLPELDPDNKLLKRDSRDDVWRVVEVEDSDVGSAEVVGTGVVELVTI